MKKEEVPTTSICEVKADFGSCDADTSLSRICFNAYAHLVSVAVLIE